MHDRRGSGLGGRGTAGTVAPGRQAADRRGGGGGDSRWQMTRMSGADIGRGSRAVGGWGGVGDVGKVRRARTSALCLGREEGAFVDVFLGKG